MRSLSELLGEPAARGRALPACAPSTWTSSWAKPEPVTMTWFGKFSRLRSFFKYAVSRGYLRTAPLPTAIPQRPPAFAPYIYSQEEIRRLLRAIDSYRRSKCLEPATIRTLILAFYGAGLRLREATNLTRADVDLSRSLLTIRNTKFGKTRSGSRWAAIERSFVSIRPHATGGTAERDPLLYDAAGRSCQAGYAPAQLPNSVRSRRHPSDRWSGRATADSRLSPYLRSSPSHVVVPAGRRRAATLASPVGLSWPCPPAAHAGVLEHDARASSRSQPAL